MYIKMVLQIHNSIYVLFASEDVSKFSVVNQTHW